jgi:hypothetical protein
MRMTPVFLGIFGVLFSQIARADCLSDFRRTVVAEEFSAKKLIIKDLDDDEMHCLFRATFRQQPLTFDFFVDDQHLQNAQVQSFYGRLSSGPFKNFEKHFFAIQDHFQYQLYGYTVSKPGVFTKSHGFFFVDWTRISGLTVLDYMRDFILDIPHDEYLSWTGRMYDAVSNNTGKVLYEGTTELLHQVSDDVAVGRTMKINEDGSVKHKTYFMLLKTP